MLFNKINFCFLLVPLSCLVLVSCSSDDPQASRLIIRMTDAPGDYQEVNVDIRDVEVNIREDADDTGWVSLDGIQPGVYNLLELTNGLDTVIADGDLAAGFISQIRLILGENNTLVMDDQVIPLNTPSAQQSGLKLNLHQTLEPGITYQVLLDFDAARSVVQAGNSGNFNLKPVIRVVAEAQDGAIAGLVVPSDANAAVYAIQNADTLGSTFTNDQGRFLIGGLAPGDYSVSISPEMGFQTQTLQGVTVNTGIVTDVGTVELIP